MTKLSPTISKAIKQWMFKVDLTDLDEAYAGALQGLQHREDEVETMVRRQLGLGPHDEFPEPNLDDPDDPIGQLYERAGEDSAQAQRGSHLVRKAFLIALFHLWERHKKPRIARESRAAADRSRLNALLDQLELAANCAKHPPGRSAKGIYEKRPDLFPRVATVKHASERTLVITPDVLNEFFEAVWATVE
ncbi:hypothetical protein EN780_32000 [Mesorhizobium sp. M4B.F.Ca.ET.089.01.1.1]|uniref:hypothetical protein n=1 Tax=Mesorhizobium sp. M4B.F.Ca.ET.089.01.1.1 TaxID=2496662 RepID=UPI000FE2A1D9|nr:hypothetical protein [Mesorhizobium sp. M4B.F.Ca.ET.089.01.1.1]RWX60445.1 hypothetical protein EN780_32000 [Mesorhizobium sp. M4B.F.Ca.ET.089.01.1.1]